MAYDPQRERRRPRSFDGPAPIDTLLGSAPTDLTTELPTSQPPGTLNGDPPPVPAVTPAPADPPSDKLLLNTGLVAAVAGIVVLLTIRHFWLRRRRRRSSTAPD